MNNAEIITSVNIMKESPYTCHKSDSCELLLVAVFMLYKDDESWFDAYKNINSWYDVSESLDKYDKWNEPPNTDGVDGVTNKSTNKYVKPNF